MGNIKRKRLHSPEPVHMPDNLDTMTPADYEKWVVQNATHFTCACRMDRGRHHVAEFKKLRDAIAAKYSWDKKPPMERHGRMALVYAVIGEGRSAMIAPSQFIEMLTLRGEQ